MATIITPTPEQLQHAKWNQLLADADRKRQEIQFEPRRYRVQFYSAMISAIVAGAIIGGVFVAWINGHQPTPQPIVIQLQAPK
jgi:uncharacterized membrane protein YoaK (UPF0700 family)